ncbi:nucleotide-diphospho-sugar transferase [Lichtheimia hyalospora FSU 10163]|nr:nucleotide-diphospho-sugar transferase [Lichtheimia hyalospora FSU 10163]
MDTVIDNSTWKDLPVKGAFYMVIESGDLQHIRNAIRSVEDRFNHRFRYPWILLSNQYLTASFRKYVTKLTDTPIFFGKIDAELWDYPSWVSGIRAEEYMNIFSSSNIKHATSFLFRQRSRYHAGFFFHHPLLQNVEYAWRVEPGSHYSCIMDIDPFAELKKNNKTMEESVLPWLIDNQDPMYAKADGFNYCQIESNFMIIKLSYLRSSEYQRYFSFLDSSGGFYYERWNDASVQTMAAAMFLSRNQLHFFNQIGYTFEHQMHCPWSSKDLGTCSCDITRSTGK